MTVGRTLAGLVFSGMLVVVGSGAQAQDRPDLLEVGPISTAFVRPDGLDYVLVHFTDTPDPGSGSGATHRQSIRVAHEFPGADGLTFLLYEPDKVTRKPSQVKWQQGDHLWARIILPAPPSPYNTFSAYGVVTGCKAKAEVKNVVGTNQVKYSFGCNNADAVMSQLAIPVPLRSYIAGLFGSKFAFKNQGALP